MEQLQLVVRLLLLLWPRCRTSRKRLKAAAGTATAEVGATAGAGAATGEGGAAAAGAGAATGEGGAAAAGAGAATGEGGAAAAGAGVATGEGGAAAAGAGAATGEGGAAAAGAGVATAEAGAAAAGAEAATGEGGAAAAGAGVATAEAGAAAAGAEAATGEGGAAAAGAGVATVEAGAGASEKTGAGGLAAAPAGAEESPRGVGIEATTSAAATGTGTAGEAMNRTGSDGSCWLDEADAYLGVPRAGQCHVYLLLLATLLQRAPAEVKQQLMKQQEGNLLLQLLYRVLLDGDGVGQEDGSGAPVSMSLQPLSAFAQRLGFRPDEPPAGGPALADIALGNGRLMLMVLQGLMFVMNPWKAEDGLQHGYMMEACAVEVTEGELWPFSDRRGATNAHGLEVGVHYAVSSCIAYWLSSKCRSCSSFFYVLLDIEVKEGLRVSVRGALCR